MPTQRALKPPRPANPPPEPKPWARETPGRYRSSDGRFAIEQGGGRWFVVDEAQHDELGLARTLGPFDTLDGAKAGADVARSAPAETSPLAERLASGARRPKPKAVSAADAPATKPPKKLAATTPPAPRRTWIDDLPAADGRRARGWIEALESMGIAKAEQIVRRDLDGNVPAVATAVLARSLAKAALSPGDDAALNRAAARLERAGASADDVRAFAALVAEDALDRALGVLSARERDPDAPSRLPGWRLVEGDSDGTSGRRLILSADEVARSKP